MASPTTRKRRLQRGLAPTEHPPGERRGRVPRSDYEAHDRPEREGRRRTQEVQTGYRGLESRAQPRITALDLDRPRELRRQEWIEARVDLIARPEQHVVEATLASVAEAHADGSIRRLRIGGLRPHLERHGLQARAQPGRARRTDAAVR